MPNAMYDSHPWHRLKSTRRENILQLASRQIRFNSSFLLIMNNNTSHRHSGWFRKAAHMWSSVWKVDLSFVYRIHSVFNQVFISLATTVLIIVTTPHAAETPNFDIHIMTFVLALLCFPHPIIGSGCIYSSAIWSHKIWAVAKFLLSCFMELFNQTFA
jgi:hypothetical protein